MYIFIFKTIYKGNLLQDKIRMYIFIFKTIYKGNCFLDLKKIEFKKNN